LISLAGWAVNSVIKCITDLNLNRNGERQTDDRGADSTETLPRSPTLCDKLPINRPMAVLCHGIVICFGHPARLET
jgi:hypothetical protein